ncbi:MAG: carbon-phosphorus lyase complex subunit PhnI [Phenylobacterium sp.]|jgi:alpha-D-ribose 1-methylphosphonate 5-triphosphate synthase subunit PhnI|uniref:carbon-phosphorus lyase complex subunit PhnI n=1 Tax=Phenylobacterium sp. TaxID=1871053 RepID=UPI002A2A1DBD|nr:carbon-phosphorus lyase complex subunit PhnI [Phenylobacterium sp.]MDD3837843.1 carbon-phosphorus lyase complex subunit PhnI [Phenylobacterium sp.]MDX9998123.1 carbon-phosphorus lyase complex subunit PhnI [Phenylobacterium sp.]
MAYVSVKGGEKAISNAHRWLEEDRRGDRAIPELSTEQIREQMSLAVDRVMAEGSCYDRDLAALAIKQARGDLPEAVFLLRAYRTTLPRFGASLPIETEDMAVRRRVSAAFKDIPGGQVLGPTFDYTHRLLDFTLAANGETPIEPAPQADEPQAYPMPTIASVFRHEDLLEHEEPTEGAGEPFDLTREPMSFPAGRDQRLQALARGDEGFLLSLAYSSQRGWGSTHPLCGEIRLGEVAVEFVPEELGFPIEVGEITVTECTMLSGSSGSATRAPQYTRGYGLTFGHCERKAMSVAIVDRALRRAEIGERADSPVQDEEFVLYHSDNVEASGFVQHLKLPHYVDFQASLQFIRTLRREFFERQAAMKEAAE